MAPRMAGGVRSTRQTLVPLRLERATLSKHACYAAAMQRRAVVARRRTRVIAWRACSALSLALLPQLFASSSTAAQALAAVELSWETPRSCPPSPRVLAEAERLLGAGFAHTAELAVEIEIEQEGSAFVLRLEIEGDGVEGERELRMQSCEEVRDAAALLIALSLDPELATRAPEPAPVASASEPTELTLAPGIGIDSSLLPSTAALLSVQLALRLAPLTFAMGGVLLWPNEVTVVAPDASFGVDVGVAAARAGVCVALLSADGLSVGPCAGIWLGRMWAEAQNSGGDRGELLVAPELSAVAEHRFSRLVSLSLRLAALVPLRSPRFELRDGGAIHQAPGVSAQAELALLVHFGSVDNAAAGHLSWRE